jgi:hypothetical protein
MKKKRAALYMRVSSGEQNTEAQERALRDDVRRRDWTIHRVYRDQGLSGANSCSLGPVLPFESLSGDLVAASKSRF